ncbi:MAG: FAD-dependent oxidoreductase [Ruminococcaceae bacterium]|nr:FAD-dependent oxidoreductase [Oscillospiraceae bacterium]
MVQKTLSHADVLVLGASVSAAGAVRILEKRGLRTVILERGQMCAPEFADALFTDGDTAAYVPETAEGADFRAELCRRGILTECGICLPAIAPVITARLKESGTTLCAPACVTEIVPLDGGYRVTFFSMGSEFILTCSAIIDTTASLESGMWLDVSRPAVRTMLGANVVGKIPGAVQGNRADECFIAEPVIAGDFDAAREALVRRAAEAGARVAMTPMSPTLIPETTGGMISDTLWHIPSAGFGTVVAAYDAGCKAGAAIVPGIQITAGRSSSAADGGIWDVIIAGGGTAGAIAALTAAREGGSVLLLEDGSCLGGMSTAGGVLGYYFGVAGGIYEEVDAIAREIQKQPGIVPFPVVGDLSKRMALGRLLREAGVTIRYGSTVVNVLRDGKRICGVRYRTDAGITEARSVFVIDATADGAVIIPAGVQTMAGRALDGSYQPFSNVFCCYDEERGIGRYRYTDNGIVSPYDPEAMGAAILQSGCSPHHLLECYTDNPRYLCTASRIGLREGKRIVGEETVRLEDLLAGNVSREPVLWGYSNLDNHGKDNALEGSLCRRWNTVASMWGYNFNIPVPAGALIPRGIDGLLAAGRCIAVDHTIASAVRMKYDMHKSGEAAAVLAMEAIRRGCAAKDVPYAALREKLLKTRCLSEETVPAVVHLTMSREATVMSTGDFWRDDPKWLKTVMESDRPGYAIWSASVHGEKLRPQLVSWIESGEEPLRSHAALALGLAGCEGVPCAEAIPHLLVMTADKSGKVPHSGRRYNYPYAISAAVLLEMLGVKEAIDAVIPFVEDPDYAAEIPYEKCELTEDQDDVIFQYTLQGFVVLVGLGKKFPEEWDRIAAVIDKRLYAEDFHLSITGKGLDTVRLDYTDKIRRLWEKCRSER